MDSLPGFLTRQYELAPVWEAIRRNPARVILVLGALLRLWTYAQGRPYWLDEASLQPNLACIGVFDFSMPLFGDQLAPIGFLIVERALVGLLCESAYVLRLVPLVSGLASLWLFRKLTCRWLSEGPALVALALFAFSDDMVYYSSELKPYASDVAVALGILLAVSRALGSPPTRTMLLTLGALVLAAPWISFPSAFLVGGCGVALVHDRLAARDGRTVVWLAVLAAGWLISFALAYRASHALLGPSSSMYVFWNFSFPPFPPRTAADLASIGGILLEVFVNPLNLVPFGDPALFVVFPALLMCLGAGLLARHDRTLFVMLWLPVVLALTAACLRRYPFHGRLILALVPAFLISIAQGTEVVHRSLGNAARRAVVLALLIPVCLSTLYEANSFRDREFNTHGALHRNRFVP